MAPLWISVPSSPCPGSHDCCGRSGGLCSERRGYQESLGGKGVDSQDKRTNYISISEKLTSYAYFLTLVTLYDTLLPGLCRTGVLSFLRVLPPLLLSTAGEGVTFSGAAGVEAATEL